MGKDELKERGIWQDAGGAKAASAERSFLEVFESAFDSTSFEIVSKPKEFRQIYVDVPLSGETLSEIFTPDEPIKTHGIAPDYKITNSETGKTLYVEVKRQDGWVEGKSRRAGRGNAHERCCKYFTPGLLKILRETSGIKEPALPFWAVFQGDITRDPCRAREITCWLIYSCDSAWDSNASKPQERHPSLLALANSSILLCVGNIFSIFCTTSSGFSLCPFLGMFRSCLIFLAPLGFGILPLLKSRHISQYESVY